MIKAGKLEYLVKFVEKWSNNKVVGLSWEQKSLAQRQSYRIVKEYSRESISYNIMIRCDQVSVIQIDTITSFLECYRVSENARYDSTNTSNNFVKKPTSWDLQLLC